MQKKIPHIRPIYWENDHLMLLDQRELPLKIEYLEVTHFEQVREAIVHLAVRGAPAIGIAAGYGVYLGIRDATDDSVFWEKLAFVSACLKSARPTAVNLCWAVDRVVDKVEEHRGKEGLEARKKRIFNEVKAIHEEDMLACRKIGEYLLSLLEDGIGVLTHCNAGGLATSAYGTALAPFYLAKEKGWNLRVFADETRPVLQGARLTAYELHEAGIDVTLICDNMAAAVMKQGWVQAVIVGTDRVAGNGDVANKIGTYSLAVLAKAHEIPFYVAAPSSSIDPSMPTGDKIPIEIRSTDEVTSIQGKEVAPAGVKVYNPAFDITPADYITAIVTEHGVVYPPFSF